ncbi:hypothetical protein THIX_60501 [Thiomonas sp. X19]|uniref:flagellar export protein FliJ n=1 Tax=Thiomonas sp. X19 TaxID=1050370 RepID=UPI000B742CF5|nr:flagellar FliJ family protein [Thiomonas sp. X19]SCC94443.1 hypothetical protein THIX_60501 [Thiomonas sp. X19]
MKTNVSVIQKLLSQAHEAEQRQAALLAQKKEQYRHALKLLNDLQAHVIHYQQRQHAMGCSVAWGEAQAMRDFIDTLKTTASMQRTEVNRLQSMLDEQTKAWTATRQRVKALEQLVSKRRATAFATQRRREQAELDDWLLHQPSQRAA